jgi:hypothetical protein
MNPLPNALSNTTYHHNHPQIMQTTIDRSDSSTKKRNCQSHGCGPQVAQTTPPLMFARMLLFCHRSAMVVTLRNHPGIAQAVVWRGGQQTTNPKNPFQCTSKSCYNTQSTHRCAVHPLLQIPLSGSRKQHQTLSSKEEQGGGGPTFSLPRRIQSRLCTRAYLA